MSFSYFERERIVESLKSEEFDLLIIGGGITGAGIALDASARGLKTALVEKNDFASGTSSRSTKLIHGGLRYLKQFEFALVKEVGSERAILHKLAPHLVLPEKMLLPLREKRGFGSLLTSLGLKLYDWLAGVTGKDRRLMLTRRQTLRKEPLLKKDDVKGGALYAEYRTDDARLTIEVIKKAFEYGSQLISYCEVHDFIYQDAHAIGVRVVDHLQKSEFEIKARVIVNAAGPWVDTLRERDNSRKGKRLHLTKGIHIVLPKEKLPVNQAIYFDIQDERMIFAIPRGRTTYVGTTDTNYKEEIDDVKPDRMDAQYLIDGINETFPTVQLKLGDIESSWAGLRPLIHEEGKSASELSRKDEIFISPSGLLSIAGGKLTGYRKMAERVVDMVIDEHFSDRKFAKCNTDKIRLSDGKLINFKSVKRYLTRVRKSLPKYGLQDMMAEYLVTTYGRQTDLILEEIKSDAAGDKEEELIKSELYFAIRHEMVCTAADFLVRRTGRLYFNIGSLKKFKSIILNELKTRLEWTDLQLDENKKELEKLISEATKF